MGESECKIRENITQKEKEKKMTVFLVDNGDTFEGTAKQADECYGIASDIEKWSDERVMEILSYIFSGSKVSIKAKLNCDDPYLVYRQSYRGAECYRLVYLSFYDGDDQPYGYRCITTGLSLSADPSEDLIIPVPKLKDMTKMADVSWENL